MVMGVSYQCIYILPDVLSSIPCNAIILGKDKRSVINRIRRIGININSTLHLPDFEQDSRNIFLSQIRRSLRTLTTLGDLRYSCLLTQRLELYPHSSLKTLMIFNGSHDIPILEMTSLTRGLGTFRVHGYVICIWF